MIYNVWLTYQRRACTCKYSTAWRKLLYSGFETCFGPSTQGAGTQGAGTQGAGTQGAGTQGAGTETHLKSRFCAIFLKRGAIEFDNRVRCDLLERDLQPGQIFLELEFRFWCCVHEAVHEACEGDGDGGGRAVPKKFLALFLLPMVAMASHMFVSANNVSNSVRH